MGKKPLRECVKPGCHNLTRDTYCSKHMTCKNSLAVRNRIYDKKYRNKNAATFYSSKEWKETREIALARSHGLCVDCLQNGILKQAEMVHHIKPLREYPKLALNLDNLKPLCNKCHGKY